MTAHGHDDEFGLHSPKPLKKRTTTLRFASSKLNLLQNPIRKDTIRVEEDEILIAPENDHTDSPAKKTSSEKALRFTKRENASTSELFYDLWFVANLTVFATVHHITKLETLISFIGYFVLLWVTWLVTTVFDARFGQDGILERIARACHLTVMIGFAMVSVSFDQSQLVRPVFRTASLFLMLSRLVLAGQYSLVFYHARYHRRTRKTLLIAIALHLAAAVTYLSVAFIGYKSPDTRLYTIWYVVGLLEMLALVLHASFSETVTFAGTHFNERLNLLTLIILGEGVIILAKNVSKIVKYTYVKDDTETWSMSLVVIIGSAAATLYIVYQLYFDWMHHHNHMNVLNQAFWTSIHLPFHIALVLLAEGGGQWAVWWHVIESYHSAESSLKDAVNKAMESMDTTAVVKALHEKTLKTLKKYGANVGEGGSKFIAMDKAFNLMSTIKNSFWDDPEKHANEIEYSNFAQSFFTISQTVLDSVSDAFDLEIEKHNIERNATTWDAAETLAVQDALDRLSFLFVYMFLCAGIVLGLLMLMHVLSKTKGWTIFNLIRTIIVFAVGVALGVLAAFGTSSQSAAEFLKVPWQLPLITGSYLFVLILTHLPHPPRITFRNSNSGDTDDMEMGKLATGQDTIYEPSQQPREPVRAETFKQMVRRSKSLKRGLTQMRKAAKNIHFEPGKYDPIAEGGLFFHRPHGTEPSLSFGESEDHSVTSTGFPPTRRGTAYSRIGEFDR